MNPIEAFVDGLDALIRSVEATGNVGLAIEAIDHMDTARKRLDRMQANPGRYATGCACALHPNCTVCCIEHPA